MRIVEDVVVQVIKRAKIEGPLKLDDCLFRTFLSLPKDPLPVFQGPTSLLRGRSKDHPRYARWMHAFVKFYKPEIAVEVGTNAGGTAIGIAKALVENGSGRLICVDNAEGVPRSFPDLARKNIISVGLEDDRFDLIHEDSKNAIPRISSQLKGKVGVYLIDAAHTFEAALADIANGLSMMVPGGFILVHDIDLNLNLGTEASKDHPHPVFEAFHKIINDNKFEWCVLKFIRKHLGVLKIK